jgi:hypothetical protein
VSDPADQPPTSLPEPLRLKAELNAQLDFSAHLTTKQFATRIRSDKRLLALLGLLVVGLPIAAW